jgi:hypothetical protein
VLPPANADGYFPEPVLCGRPAPQLPATR